MNEATIAQTVMTLLILAIFIGFLAWGIKSKQFRNVEDAKYRIMTDEHESEDGEKTGKEKRP